MLAEITPYSADLATLRPELSSVERVSRGPETRDYSNLCFIAEPAIVSDIILYIEIR